MTPPSSLLHPSDPAPFGTENPSGTSPVLFVADHAGRAIPRALGTLGLDEAALSRHVAYDIGIHGVTTRLARLLDATYVFQPYSRLVIDSNRRPGDPQSIPSVSDGTVVPGNEALTDDQRRARETDILAPYHQEILRVLAERRARRRPTVLFAMHSCTDRLRINPKPRPWHIGVIADSDWRIGAPLIDLLAAETNYCIGRNEPYTINMKSDYTVPIHAEGGRLPYVEIEIRQDLIGDERGQEEWAAVLAGIIPRAVRIADVVTA